MGNTPQDANKTKIQKVGGGGWWGGGGGEKGELKQFIRRSRNECSGGARGEGGGNTPEETKFVEEKKTP